MNCETRISNYGMEEEASVHTADFSFLSLVRERIEVRVN
jgi:hypothetical protein